LHGDLHTARSANGEASWNQEAPAVLTCQQATLTYLCC
jgi:hypothetical protein